MIETTGLVKLYGTHAALRGVSLDVPAGQVVTILGHNGSGKTTLVRILATLARPTAGRGRIGGHDLVSGRDDIRRLVAVVGHSTHLYDDLTPRENLAFAAALAGLRADRDRIDAALARVGLDGQGDTRVRALSSGLRRRVALSGTMFR
jgi:ABC-type multidrug transport system ATPase subunit